MEKKQFKMRLLALLIGVLCVYVAQAQTSDNEEDHIFDYLGKYKSDDQKYIQVDKVVIDTNKVRETALQKIQVEIGKLQGFDTELNNMLAGIGKSVQNVRQRSLLNYVYNNYVAKHSDSPNMSSLSTFGFSLAKAIITSGSVSKIKKDVDRDIINKKLADEIKALDDSVVQSIRACNTNLSNIKLNDTYYLSKKDSVPMKTITVTEENPYYRPNKAFDSGFLDYVDEIQQTVGWEWVNKEKGVLKTENYPCYVNYYFYESHPQYRLSGESHGDYINRYIYDSTGQLVRVNDFLREQAEDVEYRLMPLLYIQDFNNNKYGIREEGNAVNLAVKYKLGILKEPTTKAQKAAAKSVLNAMWNRIGAKGNYKAEYRAKKAESRAFWGAMSVFKTTPAESKASNYVSQLEQDYEGKLKNIYKIERLDNTSFKVTYIDDKGVNFCTVKVSFYNKAKYSSDCKLSLLPNDTSLHVSPKAKE